MAAAKPCAKESKHGMLTMSQLELLCQLPSPLLTAYVHTSLVEASLHGLTPGYLPWLKDEEPFLPSSKSCS